MLYAVKGNKRLQITDAEKAGYLSMGYDIAEVKGKSLKVIDVAPAKTVPYAVHKEALAKIADLEKELAKVKKATNKGDKEDQDNKGEKGSE